MTRTFVDAGVLIAAAAGRERPPVHRAAIAILDDPHRHFVSSAYVRLDVLPKAIYHRKVKEASLYEAFFERVAEWASPLEQVVEAATREAILSGLAGMDALHVGTAILLGADEFVTTERPQKPLHRVTKIKIVSIQARFGQPESMFA